MSGEVKFTPGPWMAEPMTGRGAWVKGANGTWAALSCGDTDPEAEANASLIAAAPELLEALKLVAYGGNFTNFDEAEWTVVNSAIAKAEGRS